MNGQFRLIFLPVLAIAPAVVAEGVSAIYDANGALVGEFADSAAGSGAYVHSVRGFRFRLDGETGAIIDSPTDVSGAGYGNNTTLHFTSLDCSGQAFAIPGRQNPAGGVIIPNFLRGLYYVPKAPSVTTQTLASFFSGTACDVYTIPAPTNVVPAYPNDPNVTGVPNVPYVPPVRLEMTPISSFFGIFRDGFESTQASFPLDRSSGIA